MLLKSLADSISGTIPKSSASVTGRRFIAEHAASSFALVLAEPRPPLRIRKIVGRLSSAFRESLRGLMAFARIQRSNGVSNVVPITFANA
jgi:hypothetical protein